MKIAIFSDCYLDLTGGIVSSINAQKQALEDRGHEVEVFSTGFPRTKAEIQKLAKKKIFLVPSCWLFFRGLTPISRRPRVIEKWLIKKHPELCEFDVFYVHYEAGCSIAALRLAKQLGITSVQVMHGREDMGEANIIPFGFRTIVAWFLNWFHSWYLPHTTKVQRDDYLAQTFAATQMWTLMINHANYADLVLTPSEHFRQKLLHYGVTRSVKVFPNGYPDGIFPAEVSTKELKKGETLRMIWHSRVSAEKRMMPFLKALRSVPGKWRLDVYGGGGDYFRAKRYSKRHGLPVVFHGNAKFETVQKTLSRAHLDVLVSYGFDTFGMTLIEAEAHGVPVFFCDPDMSEVVPEGGYILSDGPEPTKMAKSLNKLFAHPEMIKQMSSVLKRHREDVVMSKRILELEKILSDIISI